MHDQRNNQCREAEDEENVENVGAHDIAHREIRLALECRHDGNRQLGRTGAKGHYREADNERRNAKIRGDLRCAFDEVVGRINQKNKS